MKLKYAQKNVHDALFFGHDSGGLRLWMFIQDGKIWVQTFKFKVDNRKLIGVRYRFVGVIPRIETGQIRMFSITDLQFVFLQISLYETEYLNSADPVIDSETVEKAQLCILPNFTCNKIR